MGQRWSLSYSSLRMTCIGHSTWARKITMTQKHDIVFPPAVKQTQWTETKARTRHLRSAALQAGEASSGNSLVFYGAVGNVWMIVVWRESSISISMRAEHDAWHKCDALSAHIHSFGQTIQAFRSDMVAQYRLARAGLAGAYGRETMCVDVQHNFTSTSTAPADRLLFLVSNRKSSLGLQSSCRCFSQKQYACQCRQLRA